MWIEDQDKKISNPAATTLCCISDTEDHQLKSASVMVIPSSA